MIEIQDIYKQLFEGDLSMYPVGSVIPVVCKGKNGKNIVSILNVCQLELAEKLTSQDVMEVKIQTEITEENNLSMIYHFPFVSFRMEVIARYSGSQLFFKTLEEIDNMYMWIVDDKYNVKTVVEIGWDYSCHSDEIKKMIS